MSLQDELARLRREGEEREAQRFAKKAGYPYINLSNTPVSIEALKIIPQEEAKKAKAAAIELKVRQLALVAVDPTLPETQDLIHNLEAKKYEVKVFVVSLSSLEEAWSFYRFVSTGIKELTGKIEIDPERFAEQVKQFTSFKAVEEAFLRFDYFKSRVSDLLELILAGALSTKTSDIHYEAEEKGARIRYRIDGILHDVARGVPTKNYEALVSRIKLLCGMKLNVHDEPQDGRFTIRLEGKDIEMRVSTIPSEFGETIVMRILDPTGISVTLPQLGLREDDLAIVEEELKKPNGLILNTGPTGSGKTTTLYAFLRKLLTPEIKIITVEDPIEYRIEGIEQTQVDPEAGYTFASGLRAIVRQDPDVILVGEVRDLETADIAIQAALTGHLVLSTLHTNSAIGAIPRLVNLGVKPASIGPALSLVIAQRLVRKLCDNCKKLQEVPLELREKIKRFLEGLPPRVNRANYQNITIYEPVGCDQCNHFGYKGRRGIFEFFRGGLDVEEAILKEVSERVMRDLAERQGMVTMQEDGILKVISGLTTFDEVESVTGPIKWE